MRGSYTVNVASINGTWTNSIYVPGLDRYKLDIVYVAIGGQSIPNASVIQKNNISFAIDLKSAHNDIVTVAFTLS